MLTGKQYNTFRQKKAPRTLTPKGLSVLDAGESSSSGERYTPGVPYMVRQLVQPVS